LFSLNQDGAMLTEKCTVDIDGVSFSENTALGSGAAIRASKGSSISMRNFAAMSNRAEVDGGGVFYDASDGGSFTASYGVIQGNSAKEGRGGGMMLKRFEATAVTIALTKEYGKVTGAVTNGTHMFFLSQSYVFAMVQVKSGPGRGSISVLSGVMGVPGYRDGQQNSASPPLYLHASRSAFVMSPDMTKIYYCEKFSGSIRVISVATGDSSTIAGGQGQQGFVRDGIGGAAVTSP
jgi:predicted outer membrane repeat protein